VYVSPMLFATTFRSGALDASDITSSGPDGQHRKDSYVRKA
jgi:hypothetical protein